MTKPFSFSLRKEDWVALTALIEFYKCSRSDLLRMLLLQEITKLNSQKKDLL